jgi:hypothetical protein
MGFGQRTRLVPDFVVAVVVTLRRRMERIEPGEGLLGRGRAEVPGVGGQVRPRFGQLGLCVPRELVGVLAQEVPFPEVQTEDLFPARDRVGGTPA